MEERVAELAASGRANAEIANELEAPRLQQPSAFVDRPTRTGFL
jgi:hypothetical protein